MAETLTSSSPEAVVRPAQPSQVRPDMGGGSGSFAWPSKHNRLPLPREPRWCIWVAVVVAAAALAAVCAMHVSRPAWYDEAWMVDLAQQPSAGAAVERAMAENRPIAPGFLLLLHGLSGFDGLGLWVYRLPAVGAMVVMLVGAVVLFARLSRWVTLSIAGAMVLLASPLLQRYGLEIKQYLPAAASTVLLIVATGWWVRSRSNLATACWIALTLAVMCISFGGWFAAAGCGLTAAAVLIAGRKVGDIARVVTAGGLTVSFGAVLYLQYARYIADSDRLQSSWSRKSIPIDGRWPLSVIERFNDFARDSWHAYPSGAWGLLLVFAAVGWVAWVLRHRVTGAAAGAVVLVTLLANLVGAWPLALRVNLSLVVLLHVAAIAGPLSLIGWARMRWAGARVMVMAPASTSTSSSRPSSMPGGAARGGDPKPRMLTRAWRLGVVGCAATVIISAAVVWESRSLEYKQADVHGLLDAAAEHSQRGGLVLLSPAAEVNQRFVRSPLRGAVVGAAWPSPVTIERDYGRLILIQPQRRVLIAAGHDNAAVRRTWSKLAEHLEPYGRWMRIWRGRRASLYVFERYETLTPGRGVN